MTRRLILIGAVVALFLLAILFQINERPKQKPLPEESESYWNGALLYSDKNHALYLVDSQTLLLIKNGKQFSITAPDANVSFRQVIKGKDMGNIPLINKDISLGVILNSKSEGYILELEPDLKLLAEYPLVNNNDEHFIRIDKHANLLYYFQKGMLVNTYQVSTGKESWYTPEGTFQISNKILYPKGKSPNAPMGSRWMGLAVPYSHDKRGNKTDGGPDSRSPMGEKYGIHGTNDESTIGTYASGGCIRMYNKSMEELYAMVPVGTRAEIVP